MTQIIELTDKDIRRVILNAFHMSKKLNRDMENIEKDQIKLLEMKNTMCGVKNTLDRINCRLNVIGENKISELEAIETIQNGNREKREF